MKKFEKLINSQIKMVQEKKSAMFTKEEELLLQDFNRNVSTGSNMLFYGSAAITSALPICKYKFYVLKYKKINPHHQWFSCKFSCLSIKHDLDLIGPGIHWIATIYKVTESVKNIQKINI